MSATTYAVMVSHYNDPQRVPVYTGIRRKYDAVRKMRLEVKILEMNGCSSFELDGEIRVLARGSDVAQSTFWVRAVKGTSE